MLTTRKGLFLIVLVLLLLSGGWRFKNAFDADAITEVPTLSPQARMHILYGNKTGGGHKHGAAKPCKSEFPPTWDDEIIVETVGRIAANDNLNWRKQQNGYYVAENTVDGVRVRVVLDRERDNIVTAYPVNVKRNPCLRPPANDNE